MKKFTPFLSLILLFVGLSCTSSAQLNLVNKGKSTYSIIIPAEPLPVEIKAAKVLQSYIQKATKVTLQITSEKQVNPLTSIYLGRCIYSNKFAKKNDGFVLLSHRSALIIRGERGQGTLYGVYSLLEDLGFRKFSEEETVIPASNTLSLPSGYSKEIDPQFIYRQAYYPQSNNAEYLEWHKLQKFEDLWGVWGHSYFKIIPPSDYFKTHPEYFASVKGKRVTTQLCLSNDEVANIAIKYFKTAIAKKPWAMYWSISPNDDLGYCTCDLCKKTDLEEGGPQGSLIRFINKVADKFPETNFTTLAYTYTSHPPKVTPPAKNVYPILSSIDAYRTLPLSSEKSAASFRKDLEGWTKISPNVFIWDYTTQFTNYLAPFPDYNNLGLNLKYFKEKGVKGVFSQGTGDTYGDLAEFNSYLQAKLLWNPDADQNAIKKDFLNGYYGKAGIYIDQYITELQKQLLAKDVKLDIYGNPINNYADFLSPSLIDNYSSILDKAEAVSTGDKKLLERVYRARLPIEFTLLQQSRFFGAEKFGYLIKSGETYIVNPVWPSRVKKFVDAAIKAGVTELSEGGISPEQYLKEWENIFKSKWRNNLALNANVTLQNAFSAEYPAKRERTLVDGISGYNDFSYNWLLFYNKDLHATVDLGYSRKVEKFEVNFLSDARHYIFQPTNIIVEYSVDGKHYKLLENKYLYEGNLTEDYAVSRPKYHANFPAETKARFIRVIAKCPSELPSWRIRLNKKPSIACDEIYIN